MSQEQETQDWTCLHGAVTDKESGAVIEDKVHFYRKTAGWYDAVRYDSHERKKGRQVCAPHVHLTRAPPFTEPGGGEAELRAVLAALVPQLKDSTG